MLERVGLKLFEPEEIKGYEGTLKHDLLFFDKLLFDPNQFESNLHLAELFATSDQVENLKLFSADVAYLERVGALFPVPFDGLPTAPIAAEEIATLEAKIAALDAEVSEGADLEKDTADSVRVFRSNALTLHFHRNKLSLLRARNTSLESNEEGVSLTITTPTLSRPIHFLDLEDQAFSHLDDGGVMSFVQNAVPLPRDDVPMERVLEFARDERTRTHLAQLRNWVVDMEAKDLGLEEIATKLDASLRLYSDHCKEANIAFTRKTTQRLIALPFDILAKVATLRPGAAIASIFAFGEERQKLSALELKAPGREVAFIHHARKTLSTSI